MMIMIDELVFFRIKDTEINKKNTTKLLIN